MFRCRVDTRLAGGRTACAGSGFTTCLANGNRRRGFMLKLPLVDHHKRQDGERSDRDEERVSDVRVYGCPPSTHVYNYT